MALNVNEINARITSDARGFIAECEAEYHGKVERVARAIADNIKTRRVVLLSGPSGSGKTTSALKLRLALEQLGIGSKQISMDDYFRTVDLATAPRNEDGEVDFESPLCLDLPLINEHIKTLAKGEEIAMPRFDFPNQRRADETFPLRLLENEVVIIEGIHALNDSIASSAGEFATRLYVSARSNFEKDGKEVFRGTWTRLCRRIIRDEKFRNTDAHTTMSWWYNIRVGEKKYISPFKSRADHIINSTHPYEIGLLAGFLHGAFDALPEEVRRREELLGIPKNFAHFLPVGENLVPENSLLREFIGNANF